MGGHIPLIIEGGIMPYIILWGGLVSRIRGRLRYKGRWAESPLGQIGIAPVGSGIAPQAQFFFYTFFWIFFLVYFLKEMAFLGKLL